MNKITPCLWFNDQAEQAVQFYLSIFKNSKILQMTRYNKEGFEIHNKPAGTVMMISFEINGTGFTALNGGPDFTFSEAISLQVFCKSQEEIDYYWEKLSEQGDEKSQVCGWLKDKYGVSWQVVPESLSKMLQDENSERSERVMKEMLKMKKLDYEILQKAFQG